MNITSINLASDGQSSTEAGGDVVVSGQSSFVMDGVSSTLNDVAFATAAADRSSARTMEMAAVSVAAAGFLAGEVQHTQALPASLVPAVMAALPTVQLPDASQHAAVPDAPITAPVPESLLGSVPDHAQAADTRHALADHAELVSADHVLHLADAADHSLPAPPVETAQDSGQAAPTPLFAFSDGGDVGVMQALLVSAEAKGAANVGNGVQHTLNLPAVKEAIADSNAAHAVDAIVDHFAGAGGEHPNAGAGPEPALSGSDTILDAMVAGGGAEAFHPMFFGNGAEAAEVLHAVHAAAAA